MRAGRAFAGALVAVAPIVALVAWRRRTRPGERIDLYFGDGSTVSVAPPSPHGARLVLVSRDVLAAARP